MNNLFTTRQIMWFAISIVVIVIGYILLAQGPDDNPLSLSVAPIILVVGYCVLMPMAIVLRNREQKKAK